MTVILCSDLAPSLIDKILPTIISTLVVVSIFVLGRKFDKKIRKDEIIRNWYFKVIIEPNINVLDKFLKNSLNSIETSIGTLIEVSSKKTMNEYLQIKSKEIGKFSSIKRKFEFDFIELIRANYPEIADEIITYLQDLEDVIGNSFDKENLNAADIEDAKKEIKEFKIKLYKTLYKPIIKPAGNKV